MRRDFFVLAARQIGTVGIIRTDFFVLLEIKKGK